MQKYTLHCIAYHQISHKYIFANSKINKKGRRYYWMLIISSKKPGPTSSMPVNLITTTFPCRDVSEDTQSAEILAIKLAVSLANLRHTILHRFWGWKTSEESIFVEPCPLPAWTWVPLTECAGSLITLDNILRRNQRLILILRKAYSRWLSITDEAFNELCY